MKSSKNYKGQNNNNDPFETMRQNEYKQLANEDVDLGRQIMDKMRRQVMIFDRESLPPSQVEGDFVYKFESYLNNFRADLQNYLNVPTTSSDKRKQKDNDRATAGEQQQMSEAIVKIVKSYNILTNHMTTFFKKNSASQREHAEIDSKFNELVPELTQISEMAKVYKLKGYQDLEQISNNIFNRDYRPIKLSLYSTSKINKLYDVLRTLFVNKNLTMDDFKRIRNEYIEKINFNMGKFNEDNYQPSKDIEDDVKELLKGYQEIKNILDKSIIGTSFLRGIIDVKRKYDVIKPIEDLVIANYDKINYYYQHLVDINSDIDDGKFENIIDTQLLQLITECKELLTNYKNAATSDEALGFKQDVIDKINEIDLIINDPDNYYHAPESESESESESEPEMTPPEPEITPEPEMPKSEVALFHDKYDRDIDEIDAEMELIKKNIATNGHKYNDKQVEDLSAEIDRYNIAYENYISATTLDGVKLSHGHIIESIDICRTLYKNLTLKEITPPKIDIEKEITPSKTDIEIEQEKVNIERDKLKGEINRYDKLFKNVNDGIDTGKIKDEVIIGDLKTEFDDYKANIVELNKATTETGLKGYFEMIKDNIAKVSEILGRDRDTEGATEEKSSDDIEELSPEVLATEKSAKERIFENIGDSELPSIADKTEIIQYLIDNKIFIDKLTLKCIAIILYSKFIDTSIKSEVVDAANKIKEAIEPKPGTKFAKLIAKKAFNDRIITINENYKILQKLKPSGSGKPKKAVKKGRGRPNKKQMDDEEFESIYANIKAKQTNNQHRVLYEPTKKSRTKSNTYNDYSNDNNFD